MRQRAAIARAIATNAPILLMDEPFGALDAITCARQQDMLLQIWQSGGGQHKTVVFVTHDVDEALLLASRVLVLGVRPGQMSSMSMSTTGTSCGGRCRPGRGWSGWRRRRTR